MELLFRLICYIDLPVGPLFLHPLDRLPIQIVAGGLDVQVAQPGWGLRLAIWLLKSPASMSPSVVPHRSVNPRPPVSQSITVEELVAILVYSFLFPNSADHNSPDKNLNQ